MSHITRCPSCLTRFKVVPDQLRISNGWVRCGHCRHVFNAEQNIVIQAAGSASPKKPAPVQTQTTPAPQKTTSAASSANNQAVRPIPKTPVALAAVKPKPPVQPIPPKQPPAQAKSGWSFAELQNWRKNKKEESKEDYEDSYQATVMRGDSIFEAETEPMPMEEARRIREEARKEWQQYSSEPINPENWKSNKYPETNHQTNPAPKAPVRPIRVPAPRAKTQVPAGMDNPPTMYPQTDTQIPSQHSKTQDTKAKKTKPSNKPVPSFVAQAKRRAFWQSRPVQLLLGLSAIILITALALQILISNRDVIAAKQPILAPVLAQICAHLNCKIQPYKDPEAVVIDSTSFNRTSQDSFALSATLRNKRNWAVATPAIELTLTNIQNQAILRKVILPKELNAAASIKANDEWTTASTLKLKEIEDTKTIVGYKIKAFYP